MRFLLYNIRYGTGGGRRLPWSGYFERTTENLSNIVSFMHDMSPDVVGLLEVDSGSYRSEKQNQAQTIAESLGHYHTYRSKYHDGGFAHLLPVINKQGNAFITRDSITNETYHYFDRGMKRLVIELELENVIIFLVHLALSYRVRQHQLSDLYDLIKDTNKPYIVAGDFNVFWGDREISLFLAASDLTNANVRGLHSYPSWAPNRQLDFVLHSPGVRTTAFKIPHVLHSDHLPLVYDFEVEAARA